MDGILSGMRLFSDKKTVSQDKSSGKQSPDQAQSKTTNSTAATQATTKNSQSGNSTSKSAIHNSQSRKRGTPNGAGGSAKSTASSPSASQNAAAPSATPSSDPAADVSASPTQQNTSASSLSSSTSNMSSSDRKQPMKAQPNSPSPSPSPNSDDLIPVSISDDRSPSAVIGSKISFKGELSGDEDLLIQGHVEGTVTLKGNKLTIGKLGKVKANLSAKNIIIDGAVEGDIIADEHISINSSSVVKGNVVADRVTLEDGAKFRGSIDMDVDAKPAK